MYGGARHLAFVGAHDITLKHGRRIVILPTLPVQPCTHISSFRHRFGDVLR